VRLSGTALLEDAADIFFGDNRWEQVTVPIRFLAAEWSTGEGSAPAYPAQALERYALATVRTVALPGVDHAASIMSKAGAAATAELLVEALA
jgi:hypothetical protein